MRPRIHPDVDERARQEHAWTRVRAPGQVRCGLPVVVVLLLFGAVPLVAQDPGSREEAALLELTLVDGSVLVGTILETDADGVIRFRALGGAEQGVDPSEVRRTRKVRGRMVDGAFWHDDASPSRLYYTGTGRGLRRGEGYVGSFVLVFFPVPYVAYAVTDRISITAGTPIIPGLIGEVLVVAPRVHLLSAPRAEIGAGMLVGLEKGASRAALTYAVGTFGDADRALTVGLGVGGRSGPGPAASRSSGSMVAMVGAEARVSPRVKLVTENWIMGGGRRSIVGGGLRILGPPVETDIGIGGFVGSGGSACCLPIVNVVVPFGGGR